VACGTNVVRVRKLQFPGRKALPAGDVIHAVNLAGARLGI
jgi:methionyl-tRNA formyltransferase